MNNFINYLSYATYAVISYKPYKNIYDVLKHGLKTSVCILMLKHFLKKYSNKTRISVYLSLICFYLYNNLSSNQDQLTNSDDPNQPTNPNQPTQPDQPTKSDISDQPNISDQLNNPRQPNLIKRNNGSNSNLGIIYEVDEDLLIED